MCKTEVIRSMTGDTGCRTIVTDSSYMDPAEGTQLGLQAWISESEGNDEKEGLKCTVYRLLEESWRTRRVETRLADLPPEFMTNKLLFYFLRHVVEVADLIDRGNLFYIFSSSFLYMSLLGSSVPSKAASLGILTSGPISLLVKTSIIRMDPCVRSGTFINCPPTYPIDVSVRIQVSKIKLALSMGLEPEA